MMEKVACFGSNDLSINTNDSIIHSCLDKYSFGWNNF